ncbi:MAG: ABC transporter permease [Clostridium sp.]|nr:ABC transporter permease [Clostridium sp.]
MRMSRLAFLNFKGSAKNFLSLIFSLAFTIVVFLNFQNIIYSDTLVQIGQRNKEYADIIIRVLCFVMGVFSFFYIWYATNVFLTKRKKEIGIYIFMGLSNDKIGKMYMIETSLIGIVALVLGLVFGSLAEGLFQMILLAVAEIPVEARFWVSPKPILITSVVYLIIYGIFVWKGYFNIVRSSVLDMVSAARQNEYVKQNSFLLFLKTILGCGVLGTGFYLSTEANQQTFMAYVLGAVVLVTLGVYLMFGGLLPFVFRRLAKNKNFLYRKQRNLWVNQMIFRMKKNYRTYAMVSVLALSGVTALAAGFAVKNRYDNMRRFDNFYTFQLVTDQENLGNPAEAVILENTGISCKTQIAGVALTPQEGDSGGGTKGYLMFSYSEMKELAGAAGLDFTFSEPTENEVVGLSNMPLMSFIGYEKNEEIVIAGSRYERILTIRQPYLGYLQQMAGVAFYVVNDAVYERWLAEGQEILYTFNYRISEPEDFVKTRDAVRLFANENNQGEKNYAGSIAVDPSSDDIVWVKVLYALCGFVFAVFIMASGCIMLMKTYNDSTEEKERYGVMKKLGLSEDTLKKSIACELGAAYGLPFAVMAISSYFSVKALASTMLVSLLSVNVVSVLIILAIFIVFYLFSLSAYWKNLS